MFLSDLRSKWVFVLAVNLLIFGGTTCYWFGVSSTAPVSLPQQTKTQSNLDTLASSNEKPQEQPLVQTVTVVVEATPTPTPQVEHCDPYNEPGYFDIADRVRSDMTYVSLNPQCQPLAKNIIQRVKNKEHVPELVNKTMLFIGDSVDRYNINRICSSTKSNHSETYQDNHSHLWNSSKPVPNCFPRVCHNEALNFTFANYFMYGFDSDNVWTAKKDKFWEPFKWRDREELLLSAYKTLGRGDPHVVLVSFSLWELARFDTVSKLAGDPETMSYNQTQLDEYRGNMFEFFTRLRQALPRTRLVYRESHFPKPATGAYKSDDKPRPLRYTDQKVRQLNQVAYQVVKEFDVDYWPIGELTHNLPKDQILQDDVHPNRNAMEIIWIPGIFEYMMRTSLDYQRV